MGERSSTRAFRLVLAIAIDPTTAASCLGLSGEEVDASSPSVLYADLVRRALACWSTWSRCRAELDAAFGDLSGRADGLSPIEVARCFREQRTGLSTFELAALLWSLLRRSPRSLGRIVDRLGAELEVVAAERARERFMRSRPALPPARRGSAVEEPVGGEVIDLDRRRQTACAANAPLSRWRHWLAE